jgi:hypothetical protein
MENVPTSQETTGQAAAAAVFIATNVRPKLKPISLPAWRKIRIPADRFYPAPTAVEAL